MNWLAVAIIAGGIATYITIYDPMSLRAVAAFRYLGAAIPLMTVSALLYYVLMRLIVIPLGRGGYPSPLTAAKGSLATTQVGL